MTHVQTDMSSALPAERPVHNRVPQVTIDFWLVKLLAVTVGETAAGGPGTYDDEIKLFLRHVFSFVPTARKP